MRPWVPLVVVAFAVRVLVGLLPFDFAGPDSESYLAPATSLAEGRGYLDVQGRPTAARPPGYPAFLALVFAVAGAPSPLAARLAQAGLGAASVLLLRGALAAAAPGSRLPAAGAWLLALDPLAVGQSPYLLREALLLCLVAGVAWALVAVPGRWRIAAAGAGLAALALTHQLYALLGPALALTDLARARRRGRRALAWRLLAWALCGALVAVPLAAWARRNARETGRFTLVLAENAVPARELWLTVTCPNLWLNADPATGFQAQAWEEERRLMAERGLEGTKAELSRRAREAWAEHPLRSLGRTALMNFWYWAELPGAVKLVERLPWVRWGLLPFHWARLAAAGAGLLLVLRDPRLARLRVPCAGGLLFFALAPAPLYPIPRYLAPAAPLLDALAAAAVLESLRARARGAAPASSGEVAR